MASLTASRDATQRTMGCQPAAMQALPGSRAPSISHAAVARAPGPAAVEWTNGQSVLDQSPIVLPLS
jgi:hypothetical protein